MLASKGGEFYSKSILLLLIILLFFTKRAGLLWFELATIHPLSSLFPPFCSWKYQGRGFTGSDPSFLFFFFVPTQ